MRLHSNYKDYYDRAISLYLAEEEPVFLRFPKPLEELKPLISQVYDTKSLGKDCHGYAVIVAMVCCHKYVGIMQPDQKGAWWYDSPKDRVKIDAAWDKEINTNKYNNNWTSTMRTARAMLQIDKKKKRRGWRDYVRYYWGISQQKALTAYQNVNQLYELVESPILTVTFAPNGSQPYDVNIGPNLGLLGFDRLMDPYTVVQELQVWFGVHALQGKEIPTISDEDLARSKGYDEFSFRKAPTKRKGKR